MAQPPVDPERISRVELFGESRLATLEHLAGDLFVMLGGGIVNPFGPTLQLIAATGPWQAGTAMPLIQAMVNPFSQSVSHIGTFHSRDLIDPVQTLRELVPKNAGGCPTALLVSPLLRGRAEDTVACTAAYVAACDSGLSTLEGVKNFPGDPRSRVKHDIAESMKIVMARQKGRETAWPEDPRLSADQATELVLLQLCHDHWVSEWEGFVTCWAESLEHQRQTGLARTALPYSAIQPMLNAIVDMSYNSLAGTFPDWEPHST